MADQTIVKPLGLTKDIRILVHGIPYVMTFTIIQSSVLNSRYFMLLGCPWLRDVKMSHDWGNNTIIIQGTNTIKTIFVTKKLGTPTKHPEVLVCYDFHSGIFDKKKDLMFATKPRLFSIGIIVVLASIWSNQNVKLITSTSLNLVKHVNKPIEPMFKPLVSSNILVKAIPVQSITIAIPHNTFQ